MSKNRVKTNLIHKKDGEVHEISREKATGKYFIKNTDIEVSNHKLSRKREVNSAKNYNFNKPYLSQFLGDEWDDFPWSADDF